MKVPKDGKIPGWQAWVIGMIFMIVLIAGGALIGFASFIMFTYPNAGTFDFVVGSIIASMCAFYFYKIITTMLKGFKHE